MKSWWCKVNGLSFDPVCVFCVFRACCPPPPPPPITVLRQLVSYYWNNMYPQFSVNSVGSILYAQLCVCNSSVLFFYFFESLLLLGEVCSVLQFRSLSTSSTSSGPMLRNGSATNHVSFSSVVVLGSVFGVAARGDSHPWSNWSDIILSVASGHESSRSVCPLFHFCVSSSSFSSGWCWSGSPSPELLLVCSLLRQIPFLLRLFSFLVVLLLLRLSSLIMLAAIAGSGGTYYCDWLMP